jgi:hypothetical protein
MYTGYPAIHHKKGVSHGHDAFPDNRDDHEEVHAAELQAVQREHGA